jgi:hypothetical protein
MRFGPRPLKGVRQPSIRIYGEEDLECFAEVEDIESEKRQQPRGW